jgi:hypothetical protein
VCLAGGGGARDGFYYVDMTGNLVYFEEEEKECEFNYRHFHLSFKVDFVDSLVLTINWPNSKCFKLNKLSLKQIFSLNS